MKIIALLPVKNEAWILPTYLSSVLKIADKIIALDNGSTDNTRAILESAGAIVIPYSDSGEINMSYLRMELLEAGRRAGGTHFIWLDADEAFSSPFNENGREIIAGLRPGEKLSLRWITLWQSTSHYRDDGVWNDLYKDFIVCDKPGQGFTDQFLSEARTPGQNNSIKRLPESKGVVLHFQFVAWQRVILKQSYYRMRELIEKRRSARRINATYSITLPSSTITTREAPSDWFKNLILPKEFGEESTGWYIEQIFQWFDKYGIQFFEPLQIWQIEELDREFIKKIGRSPKSRTYPDGLIRLKQWLNKLVIN
jgi:glycosyltransferase involved in cell wall biosynthesis